MSGGITFGATITGGIQNIAGLLPLLGTQQCEEHIGSALTKGYLYAAATPMSIFGSLGVARAGFKTLIACISGRTWSGATILANMGFEPKGVNLSLVMIDKDDKGGRHLAETRLDELVKELHIDPRWVTVSHKCTQWNVTMILLTAFLSSLSMIPYIQINLGGNNLTHFSQWTFPILRAVGGFLTASMMQIVLERRISRLTASHLAQSHKSETIDNTGGSPSEAPGNTMVDDTQRSKGEARSDANAHRDGHSTGTGDVEKGLGIRDASTEERPGESISSLHDTVRGCSGILDWVFLVLLLAGILSSVVGYVGCFSVVQNAKSRIGPLSWLCSEAGLSVVRMILWGLNPKGDDAPPLELVLRLDHDAPLPTCNMDNARILQEKVLPLTRSDQFLNMVTSFAGLVERFTHPNLTLYYTMTRKQLTDLEPSDQIGKRVLYITLFDHKERTTRVYTRAYNRECTTDHFYSTEADVPFIDLRHGLLETKLDKEIISKDDPIAGDTEIHFLLRKHYQSIMDQIHFTFGETHNTSASTPLPPAYAIENKWTMKTTDTVGARERRRKETFKKRLGRKWQSTVERGQRMEVGDSQPTFQRDRLYLEHGRIEKMRQSLDAARGRWIDNYMELVTRETKDCWEGETAAIRRVDGRLVESEGAEKEASGHKELQAVVEEGLIDERCLMEKLLVYEVEAWEWLVWTRLNEFSGRNDVPESGKERLTREWRGNCWKRLDANIRAMDARMDRVKAKISALPDNELQSTLNLKLKNVHDVIQRAWLSVIERLVDNPMPSASSAPGACFNDDVQKNARRIDNPWRRTTPRREQQRRHHQEMTLRLTKELADVEFRIAQGLDRCYQFFDDAQLLECRHSRAKTLLLDSNLFDAPLEFYSRALKCNDLNDVIYVRFFCDSDREYSWFAETIRDLPLVTSISVRNRQLLPPIQRDTPLFIYDDRHAHTLETFLKNDRSLACTRDTRVFMSHANNWMIAVSFISPPSGNLILRLKHYARKPDTTLTVLGTSFSLTVPESLTIDDINLYSIDNSSSPLSFVPNTRSNLILQISSPFGYTLQDVQLLDEEGDSYGQPVQRDSPATQFDTPDNHQTS